MITMAYRRISLLLNFSRIYSSCRIYLKYLAYVVIEPISTLTTTVIRPRTTIIMHIVTMAGKVGLASHWPCDTDSMVYPPMASMAWEREISTPPKLHSEYYGIFTFTFTSMHIRFQCLFRPSDR